MPTWVCPCVDVMGYTGRFAPSPSGPLHAGSLVAALASWLDARAHGGRWLVRIEDIDVQRCHAQWVPVILRQLQALGLQADEPPVWQSHRTQRFEQALQALQAQGAVYACDCSRKAMAMARRHHPSLAGQPAEEREIPYTGTCRDRGLQEGPGVAWRLRTGDANRPVQITWHDRRLGRQTQNVTAAVGDFVLRRRDGLWAYQLAVVVDDADQGITHIVRGEDLSSNTARQIHLQKLWGLATPTYLHTPLVLDAQARKLSKHTGAPAICVDTPSAVRQALHNAARVLELELHAEVWQGPSLGDALQAAVAAWKARWAVA